MYYNVFTIYCWKRMVYGTEIYDKIVQEKNKYEKNGKAKTTLKVVGIKTKYNEK